MIDRAVIALEIVLNNDLPVRHDVVRLDLCQLRVSEAIAAKTHRTDMIGHRDGRLVSQTYEDQSEPNIDVNAPKPPRGAIEIIRHMRRCQQRPVRYRIAPPVIGTNDPLAHRPVGVGTQPRATMGADVVIRAYATRRVLAYQNFVRTE